MTDPFEESYGTPDDGVWPGEEAWLAWTPESVTEGFVERTLDALRRSGEPDLSPNVLAAYAVPTPSDDFVERTLEALRADREQVDDLLTELLTEYRVPEPSPDFVERTLVAVRTDRRRRSGRRWLLALPLAAAAAVAVLLFALRPVNRFVRVIPSANAAAGALTPAPLATALSLQLRDSEGPIGLFPSDPLLLLADGVFED